LDLVRLNEVSEHLVTDLPVLLGDLEQVEQLLLLHGFVSFASHVLEDRFGQIVHQADLLGTYFLCRFLIGHLQYVSRIEMLK
jgi:hypothetical protein